MAHKRVVGGLAAAALTASSLGVAAGPALATGTPPKPHFAKVAAKVDGRGDLDIAFREVGLKSGQKVRVSATAETAKAIYAIQTKDGVKLLVAKAHDVSSKAFKARAISFNEKYGWFVKGAVELKHPLLPPPKPTDGAGTLPGPGPAPEPPKPTLIKVVYKGTVLTDAKTHAFFRLPSKITENFAKADKDGHDGGPR